MPSLLIIITIRQDRWLSDTGKTGPEKDQSQKNTSSQFVLVEERTIRAIQETNKTHPGKQHAEQRNKKVGP